MTPYQEKLLDILESTKEYYSQDPRHRRSIAIFGGKCLYRHSNTACSVGRFLPDNLARDFDKLDQNDVLSIWDKIKHLEPFKDTHKAFWQTLQIFHDENNLWTEKNISQEGITFYKNIKTKILSGTYDLETTKE